MATWSCVVIVFFLASFIGGLGGVFPHHTEKFSGSLEGSEPVSKRQRRDTVWETGPSVTTYVGCRSLRSLMESLFLVCCINSRLPNGPGIRNACQKHEKWAGLHRIQRFLGSIHKVLPVSELIT